MSSLRHRRRRELARKLRATQKALFKEQELRVDAQLELEVSTLEVAGVFAAQPLWLCHVGAGCTLYGARAGSCCAGNECWQ